MTLLLSTGSPAHRKIGGKPIGMPERCGSAIVQFHVYGHPLSGVRRRAVGEPLRQFMEFRNVRRSSIARYLMGLCSVRWDRLRG